MGAGIRTASDAASASTHTRGTSFKNLSTDILGIFTASCDRLGVRWTRASVKNISIARREDVAFLDTFIGPKC